jgi:hypothetical protein
MVSQTNSRIVMAVAGKTASVDISPRRAILSDAGVCLGNHDEKKKIRSQLVEF